MTTVHFATARAKGMKAAAAALIVTQTACTLLSGECTFETRSLSASGDVNEGGVIAHASVTVWETRGSLTEGDIHGIVSGSMQSGQILSAAIKDLSGSQQGIALGTRPPSGGILAEGGAGTTTVNLAAYHDLIVGGTGVIELQTDITSHTKIAIPLVPASNAGWLRPNCS